MAHDWQLRWWLDDAGQRTAPFLLPNKLENDFIAELRDGCFEPARLGHAVWRDVDASKRLQGKPALTPAQRKQVLRKTISARILAIEQSGGSDMHLTLDRGARDGVFVGEKFRFPFRVISVLENSAIVSGPTAIVDNSLKVGDSFVSSTPGTLVACPNEPDLSLDAAFPASRVH